jgi:hypothetical protein
MLIRTILLVMGSGLLGCGVTRTGPPSSPPMEPRSEPRDPGACDAGCPTDAPPTDGWFEKDANLRIADTHAGSLASTVLAPGRDIYAVANVQSSRQCVRLRICRTNWKCDSDAQPRSIADDLGRILHIAFVEADPSVPDAWVGFAHTDDNEIRLDSAWLPPGPNELKKRARERTRQGPNMEAIIDMATHCDEINTVHGTIDEPKLHGVPLFSSLSECQAKRDFASSLPPKHCPPLTGSILATNNCLEDLLHQVSQNYSPRRGKKKAHAAVAAPYRRPCIPAGNRAGQQVDAPAPASMILAPGRSLHTVAEVGGRRACMDLWIHESLAARDLWCPKSFHTEDCPPYYMYISFPWEKLLRTSVVVGFRALGDNQIELNFASVPVHRGRQSKSRSGSDETIPCHEINTVRGTLYEPELEGIPLFPLLSDCLDELHRAAAFPPKPRASDKGVAPDSGRCWDSMLERVAANQGLRRPRKKPANTGKSAPPPRASPQPSVR